MKISYQRNSPAAFFPDSNRLENKVAHRTFEQVYLSQQTPFLKS